MCWKVKLELQFLQSIICLSALLEVPGDFADCGKNRAATSRLESIIEHKVDHMRESTKPAHSIAVTGMTLVESDSMAKIFPVSQDT